MNKLFFPKIAAGNIKKNTKMILPYMIASICTIMMFYNMRFLPVAKLIGSESESLRVLLGLGCYVIGIFSVIFLFYTNSFLIKQRKKEFGLLNILGMEKKHIALVMFFETLYTSLISLAAGILGGILISKLILMLLLRAVSFDVAFGFEIPVKAILTTLALFGGIFMINLVHNIFAVHLAKPVELLKGGQQGEKEPKTKWIMTVIGMISLGAGYFIALTTESPLAALNSFFIAVLLVIVGTYCLFTAGSIAALKVFRKFKKFYYQPKHFISVSGMIYRMKQNAAGLANICILATIVIVVLSTTISIYVGIEDVLRNRYPSNIIVSGQEITDEQANQLDAVILKQTTEAGMSVSNETRFRSTTVAVLQDKAWFKADALTYSSSSIALLHFIPEEDYSRMSDKPISLSDKEVLLYTANGDIPGDIVDFNGLEFAVRERLGSLTANSVIPSDLIHNYYIVVKDKETVNKIGAALNDGQWEEAELAYYYGFDVDGSREAQQLLIPSLQQAMTDSGINSTAEGAEVSRDSIYTLYGGLFFLGLFYLFKTILLLSKDTFWSIALTLLIFSSPVLVYYGNNYLSNSTAFAFTLVGWYFFIRFLFFI